MFAKLFLLALCAAGAASAARTCASVNVPLCQIRVNRDLLFLVDASDSLDPVRFNKEMLDYVQSLFCAFNPLDVNRAGMITFAKEITTRIPLDTYTPAQWFSQVDDIRSQNLCCSCCTPTATAFYQAKQIFDSIPIGNAYRIVFVITDGAPWQNPNVDDALFGWPKIPSATYTWGTVPQTSSALKLMENGDQTRVRVMMVGVPNKFGDPPRNDYFEGKPDPAKRPAGKSATWQCQERSGKTTCFDMSKSPFPIITEPVDKNIFTSNNYNVTSLIELTVGSLCEILPTPAPTKQPTTQGPTSRAPTNSPTKKPTFGPTNPPTSRTPSNSPTKKPTFAPTKPPTFVPTSSPTKPELAGLDMYLLLDRSRSMRWVPSLCRAAPGGNPQDGDTVACWRLFLTFVRSLVTKSVQIPYRNTVVGWKDDSPEVIRGLRVWMYAFACSDHQSDPVLVKIGEQIGSAADFETAMTSAYTLIPDGGTCPGATIERTVAMIQGNDLLTRIYKTAILITDGVFYDMPQPRLAAQGLKYFGALTYSLGISIPSEGEDWGLTPAEIKTQRTQLLNFVQGDETRLFNFGAEGLNLLPAIAQELVDQLPYDALARLPVILEKPYWCGWTSEARCTETNPANTNTGQYCFWNSKSRKCFPKNWCQYTTKMACQKDQYCVWSSGKCSAKPGVEG